MPDLDREDIRVGLSGAAFEAVSSLADIWRLNSRQMAGLLALASESEWFHIRTGRAAPVASKDLLSDPLADEWIRIPNNEALFEGLPPAEVMARGGFPAMMRTPSCIDALRGGL